MKKIYSLLGCALLFAGQANAQLKKIDNPVHANRTITKKQSSTTGLKTAAGCDTLSLSLLSTTPSIVSAQLGGYLAGQNAYGDDEKGGLFYYGGTGTHIGKAFIFLHVANSNVPANLSKTVTFKVMSVDDITEMPATELASVTKTLQQLKDDVDNQAPTVIDLPTPVPVPSNGLFAITMDISNLQWTGAVNDSISFVTTEVGTWEGMLIEKYQGDWGWAGDSWQIELTPWIFPIIGDATCAALPVSLVNFKAVNKGKTNVITWSTLSESNNAGFDVERSANGKDFVVIGVRSSQGDNGNSSHKIDYNFTDENPLSGTNYYRLVQKDKDGKRTLSSVVSVNSLKSALEITSVYPNPAAFSLNVKLNSSTSERVEMTIVDMAGRTYKSFSQFINSGSNLININVDYLAPGIYTLKVVSAKGTETVRFVK